MRLNINLATQPYEDARRFLMIWSAALGVLLLLVIGLAIGVVRHWNSYRQMSANVNRERQILQDLDRKQQQDLAILNRPENRDVREKSEFINSLIHRKEVSWTTIFTNLEQLMPSHLRVLGIAPQIREDHIILQMELGGDSRERAAELARRMEKSSVFRDAQIVNESATQLQPGQPDNMRFQMTAEFVPGQNLTKPEPENGGAQTSNETHTAQQTARNGGSH
ncbi:MAG: hypothetical protein ACXVZX_02735 [Terriglobales bacterium]